MKSLKYILLLSLIVSCAPIYVNYDYEKATDFSKYKTYNFYSDMKTGLSELDEKRFFNVLNEKLAERGLTQSDAPDFFIDIKSSEYEEVPRNNVGVGLGGSGGNVGGGISIGIPVGQSKVNRQIIMDFVDENQGGLFWQAVSESSFNPDASPEKREERLSAIVNKILEGFPPKTKG